MAKHVLKLTLNAALLLCLTGCASYFERSAQKHCFRGDWLAQGFDAGKRGKPFQSEWQASDSRCEHYNLWSNKSDYAKGYSLGKEAFCQTDNGFEFGLRNKRYTPICEGQAQLNFDQAYNDGQQLYRVRRDVEHYQNELAHSLDFIDYAFYRRKELAEEIDSGKLDKETEKKYIKERYKLKKRRKNKQYALPRLRADLREAEKIERRVSYQLEEFYDVYGTESSEVYSVNQKVKSENRLVTQAAVIVYAPRKPKTSEGKAQRKEVSLLTDFVRTHHHRDFRYQVLNDGELSFISASGGETRVNLTAAYQDRARILLWSPTEGLSAEAVTTMSELAPLVSKFIRNHSDKVSASRPNVNAHKSAAD